MKTTIIHLFILVAVACARAATPAEEAAFTAAAKKAFEADKPAALYALVVWDGVPVAERKEVGEMLALFTGMTDVQVALRPATPQEKARKAAVPVTHILSVAGKSEGAKMNANLSVGEKMRRLMIVPVPPDDEPAPPPATPARPGAATPPAPPVPVAPPAPPGAAPRIARRGENLVANGDFSAAANGAPAHWTMPPGGRVATETGNGFLQFDNATAWVFGWQTLPVPDGARTLRGSARFRLKQPQDQRSNTTVIAECLDAGGAKVGEVLIASSPKKVTAWTEQSAPPRPLPAGTKSLKLGIHNKGLVELDDIRVIAE